jgi:hypothetical protein
MRMLANAADPSRAHSAAEALSGLRVLEAVPLILDRIEDPLFSYNTGSLVYHLVELDCRAHMDRVVAILVRDGLECCMNASSAFRHRRGPLAYDVLARALDATTRFIRAYEAGEHRESPSPYHARPLDRYETVVWAHETLLTWNQLESAFPRQGDNRSLGERTPDWTPISVTELARLVAGQVALLDDEYRDIWRRFVTDPPVRIRGARQLAEALGDSPDDAYCLARNGREVLLYDDVQDVFAHGRVDADGSVSPWYEAGEELSAAIAHSLSSA